MTTTTIEFNWLFLNPANSGAKAQDKLVPEMQEWFGFDPEVASLKLWIVSPPLSHDFCSKFLFLSRGAPSRWMNDLLNGSKKT